MTQNPYNCSLPEKWSRSFLMTLLSDAVRLFPCADSPPMWQKKRSQRARATATPL